MPTDPPPPVGTPLRMLVAGGLTIDRFAVGDARPGGAILHGGLAAAAAGAATTFLTVAGEEPVAREGLARLAAAGELQLQAAASTISFEHHVSEGRRALVYLGGGTNMRVTSAALGDFDAVLLAPVVDELPPAQLAAAMAGGPASATVLLIQGWLRRLVVGELVVARELDQLPATLWPSFAAAAAIVCSAEDLPHQAGAAADPAPHLRSLRKRVGPGPAIVLTTGAIGCVVDERDGAMTTAVGPPRVIDVSEAASVGAGDAFGAHLALRLARGASPSDAAAAAMAEVGHWLERRA